MFSISPVILEQYVGSYQLGPHSIARVTLEDNQLYIGSCPLLGLSVSRDIVRQYESEYMQNVPEVRKHVLKNFVIKELDLMSHSIRHKKYPVYARSETVFVTKNKFPARIEFFKSDKGEVTHFTVTKNLIGRHPFPKNIEKEGSNFKLYTMKSGKKIQP